MMGGNPPAGIDDESDNEVRSGLAGELPFTVTVCSGGKIRGKDKGTK
jgi:hypothetical protein